MKGRISKQCRKQVKALAKYIETKGNSPKQASILIDTFNEKAASICKMPTIGIPYAAKALNMDFDSPYVEFSKLEVPKSVKDATFNEHLRICPKNADISLLLFSRYFYLIQNLGTRFWQGCSTVERVSFV